MGFFNNLIEELISDGNIVDIATNESGSPVPDFFKELGCKVYHTDSSRSPFSFGNIKAISQIRELVKKNGYDIVHCHSPLAAASTRIACKGLRKKGKVKVIYTAHGFHFYKGAPLKNWMIFYPIEKLCSHYTDVLITINKEDFELAKRKMKAKKIEYVPGVGIDVAKFAGAVVDRKQKRAEIGVPEDAFMLLSVGELNENKNHKVVIEALSKLKNPNNHYVIAGTGGEKENLQKLAEELDVNLHLLGYRDDIAELNKVADCFVFPSIREGQGISVLEAIACGNPCIVSNIRGPKDIIDGENGLACSPFSVDDFSIAISRLKDNDMLRNNIVEKANKIIYTFDLANVNCIMAGIYDDAISNS